MAALSTPTAPASAARSHPSSSASIEPSERHLLLQRAEDYDQQARQSAEDGDLASAARLILQALDCERRAGGLGPQVLQLIKPR
ncbi:MAG: hypothetical protein VKO44_04225 [Cyanobacteriota bacterium]|nr:hypothetical protein [Cyanobacteriota bacterium]